MQYSSAFSIALLSLAQLIVADSETFGFLSINSGTSLQYASAYSDNGSLMLGSSDNSLSGTITDDGTVRLSDSSYIVVASGGPMTEGSQNDATTEFSIMDGRLAYKGSEGFYAIPSGSAYLFSTTAGNGGVGVAIKAIASSGQSVPDFSPNGHNSSSSTTTTIAPTSSGNASTSSWVPGYNSTTYYPTNSSMTTKTQTATNTTTETCTSCPIIQTSTNGVNKLVTGMGSGVFAAVAAFLL